MSTNRKANACSSVRTFSSSPRRGQPDVHDGADEVLPSRRRQERTTFPGAVAMPGIRQEDDGTVEYSLNNSTSPVTAQLVTGADESEVVNRLLAENQLLREREKVLSLRLKKEQMQRELEQMRERNSLRDQEQEAMRQEQEVMLREREAMIREREEMRQEQEETRRELERMSALLQNDKVENLEKPPVQLEMNEEVVTTGIEEGGFPVTSATGEGRIHVAFENEDLGGGVENTGRGRFKCLDSCGQLWCTRPRRLALVGCLVLLIAIAVIVSVLLTRPPPPLPPPVTGGECVVVMDSEGRYCLKSHAGVGNAPYSNNQDCVFTIHKGGVLDVRIFGTYNSVDYLDVTISGVTTRYDYQAGPDGVTVNRGDQLVWHTSSLNTDLGFEICIV